MLSRVIPVAMMMWSAVAVAAEVVDATGRAAQVPDKVTQIVPAGPPAAVLLEAIAPDLIAGWPAPLTEDKRALLSPSAAKLPENPRLTGHSDVAEEIKALRPDLILDYGRAGNLPSGHHRCDPDILIFAEPMMPKAVEQSDAWKSLHPVREGHALIAPGLPFGWVEEPPSINRLIGLAWLSRGDPVTLASLSNAVVYGRPLTTSERATVLAGVRSVQP